MGLFVASQRRHSVQTKRRQIGRLQHRNHTAQSQSSGGVDRLDAGMGILAAQESPNSMSGILMSSTQLHLPWVNRASSTRVRSVPGVAQHFLPTDRA